MIFDEVDDSFVASMIGIFKDEFFIKDKVMFLQDFALSYTMLFDDFEKGQIEGVRLYQGELLNSYYNMTSIIINGIDTYYEDDERSAGTYNFVSDADFRTLSSLKEGEIITFDTKWDILGDTNLKTSEKIYTFAIKKICNVKRYNEPNASDKIKSMIEELPHF